MTADIVERAEALDWIDGAIAEMTLAGYKDTYVLNRLKKARKLMEQLFANVQELEGAKPVQSSDIVEKVRELIKDSHSLLSESRMSALEMKRTRLAHKMALFFVNNEEGLLAALSSEATRNEVPTEAKQPTKEYYIRKVCRISSEQTSYCGPTWDTANIRHKYKEKYNDRQEAESIATILSTHNPVGFVVEEVKQPTDTDSKERSSPATSSLRAEAFDALNELETYHRPDCDDYSFQKSIDTIRAALTSAPSVGDGIAACIALTKRIANEGWHSSVYSTTKGLIEILDEHKKEADAAIALLAAATQPPAKEG